MTPEQLPRDEDPAADTQMFRQFAERRDEESVVPVGSSFRIITLLIGLIVLAGLIYLMFRL